jgi:transposase
MGRVGSSRPRFRPCVTAFAIGVQQQRQGWHSLPESGAQTGTVSGDARGGGRRTQAPPGNGTTPIDASSGKRERHRHARAGNPRITARRTSSPSFTCDDPGKGRAHYDAHKPASMPTLTALRARRRRLSNIVDSRMLADQQRGSSATPPTR